MDIYQIRTFAVVSREGSITRAAEQVFLSQPAVSAHIKALEDELGLMLFERTPKGMVLTPDGERLLSYANEILEAHRRLVEEAQRLKGRIRGKLTIGVAHSMNPGIFGRLLSKLSHDAPAVELRLENTRSSDIIRNVRAGTMDAGFILDGPVGDSELTIIPIDRVKIYLAAPPDMPGGRLQLDWRRLADMPWICPASTTCCGRIAEQIFHEHGFRPAKIVNVDHEGVTCTLVAGGVGVGLLHQESAFEAQRRGEIILLGGPQDEVPLQFIYPTAHTSDPVLAILVAAVLGLGSNPPEGAVR